MALFLDPSNQRSFDENFVLHFRLGRLPGPPGLFAFVLTILSLTLRLPVSRPLTAIYIYITALCTCLTAVYIRPTVFAYTISPFFRIHITT